MDASPSPKPNVDYCGHRDGCLPYAQAISEGEAANKCVPGGQPVADALAQLLNRPALIAEESILACSRPMAAHRE